MDVQGRRGRGERGHAAGLTCPQLLADQFVDENVTRCGDGHGVRLRMARSDIDALAQILPWALPLHAPGL